MYVVKKIYVVFLDIISWWNRFPVPYILELYCSNPSWDNIFRNKLFADLIFLLTSDY